MVPSLVKVRAYLEINPEIEHLKAETQIVLKNVDVNEIELILAVRVPESTGKFDIIEITQQENPCNYRITPDRLYIIPNKLDEKMELVIKYEGKARQDFDDYIKKDEIILRMDGAWLPLIPSSSSEFDITLIHPSNYTFFGQGIRKKTKCIDENRTESQWNIKAVNGFTLYGSLGYKIKETKIGDTNLIIALWPKDSDLLLELSKKVTTILHRLIDFLGEYPYPVVRVVESGRWEGKSGYGAISNISLGYQMLREGNIDTIIAHELAHGWWGGSIPNSQEALYKGQWNETLTEYTSIFALEKQIATNLREKWSLNYASLDKNLDVPMLEIGSYSTSDWRINEAITYHKGALLMTLLEDRISLPLIIEIFTKVIKDRKGKPSTWEHILIAIANTCGIECSQWFRDWLSMNLAPELKFKEVTNSEGIVSGKLYNNRKSSHKGIVEIGCYYHDELIQIHLLPFDEYETPFSFTLPNNVNRLVLDPRKRLPRRFNPAITPIEDGCEVSI